MLRYKNSLLERVLLEKGRSYLIGTLALHALTHFPLQALTFRLSSAQRRAVLI
jgi:hypothetical protein